MKKGKPRKVFPRQKQRPPGKQKAMKPVPITDNLSYRPSGKLSGKVAVITGADSGIGQAIAIIFAKEGADVVVVYLDQHEDAETTKDLVEKRGRSCLLIAGDVGKSSFCNKVIDTTIKKFGRVDILVNNAAEQHPKETIEEITDKQWEKTFQTNIFGYFYLTRAAMPHLRPESTIINISSVTAYRGSEHLLDYSSTKGAIVAFTRSLATNLADKGIRVNGIAPGPIWTPLIVSTFPPKKSQVFGSDVPMKRAGQPYEVATSAVFLASDDSSYMTGQFLHPNGGEIVNV